MYYKSPRLPEMDECQQTRVTAPGPGTQQIQMCFLVQISDIVRGFRMLLGESPAPLLPRSPQGPLRAMGHQPPIYTASTSET